MEGGGTEEPREAPGLRRELYLSLENRSGTSLSLMSFFLVSGAWHSQAPSGPPMQGTALHGGNVCCWGTYTSVPYTGLEGGMMLQGADGWGQLALNWTWEYGGHASVTGTLNIPNLVATIKVTEEGYSQATARIVLTDSV